MGRSHRHRATVRGLGLRRMNQTVVVADTPEIRGMLNASRHLLRVEEKREAFMKLNTISPARAARRSACASAAAPPPARARPAAAA